MSVYIYMLTFSAYIIVLFVSKVLFMKDDVIVIKLLVRAMIYVFPMHLVKEISTTSWSFSFITLFVIIK